MASVLRVEISDAAELGVVDALVHDARYWLGGVAYDGGRRCVTVPFAERVDQFEDDVPVPAAEPVPSPWWRPFTRFWDVPLVACRLTVHEVESWDVPPDTDGAAPGMLDAVQYAPEDGRVSVRAFVGPGVVAVVSRLVVEVEVSDRVAGLARVGHGLLAESERLLRLECA